MSDQWANHFVMVGGGAAGMFAAIACAEAAPQAEVTVCEATAQLLSKVRISGGGRCNVTNACLEPAKLVEGYPRGGRELLGPFTRFGPRETVAWFSERGVALKAEADGRMFPTTDDAATVIDCLVGAAARAGVRLRTRCGVRSIRPALAGRNGFAVELLGGETIAADRVLIATGGTRGAAGTTMAQELGHTVEPQVPSLFTFHIGDERLRGLAGVSVADARVAVPGTNLRADGPVLVTHWGLSGPAILRLSAWGARILHAAGYQFKLTVHWAPPLALPQIRELLAAERREHPRRQVATANPFGLPGRLWERLAGAAGFGPSAVWAGAANSGLDALAGQIGRAEFLVTGKSLNKEEFVTCGGVRLREVDFATMESRIRPGLHFAGEVLDLDGITGGFNLQAAWTTGWHAGRAMAAS